MRICPSLEEFLTRFTYRQRFIIFALVYALGMPLPTYMLMRVQNVQIQSLSLQEVGLTVESHLERFLNLVVTPALKNEELSKSSFINWENDTANTLRILRQLNEDQVLPKITPISQEFSTPPAKMFDLSLIETDWLQRSADEKAFTTKDIGQFLIKVSKKITLAMRQTAYNSALLLNLSPCEHVLAVVNFEQIPALQIELMKLAKQGTAITATQLQDLKKISDGIFANLSDAYKTYSERKHDLDFEKAATHILKDYQQTIEQSIRDVRFISILNTLVLVADFNRQVIKDQLTAAKKSLELQQTIYMISILIAVLTVAFYLWFHLLSHHFIALKEHIQALAKGQFIKCFCADGIDEFGPVGRAFDQMGQAVQAVVSELKKLSNQLADSIGQITKTAQSQEGTMANQEHNIVDIEASAKMITTHSRDLADTMNELNISSRENPSAQKASQGLAKLQTEMKTLATVSETILDRLGDILNRANSLSGVTAFMARISDQANLLSLNSAIETANVISNRQSFLKITQEIQRFAEKTAASNKEIDLIIKDMVENITTVKREAITCLKEISEGTQRLAVVHEQLTSIANQGEEQLKKFESVNDVMQVQAYAAENIIQTISAVGKTARENTQHIHTLHTSTEELGGTAKQLKRTLNLFFGGS